MTFRAVFMGLCFCLGVWLATIAADYVDQQRGVVVGMCPPFASPNGAPGLLVFDNRTAQAFCVPLPMPNKMELPASPPDANKKQGV